jgi:hypothetical protein
MIHDQHLNNKHNIIYRLIDSILVDIQFVHLSLFELALHRTEKCIGMANGR